MYLLFFIILKEFSKPQFNLAGKINNKKKFLKQNFPFFSSRIIKLYKRIFQYNFPRKKRKKRKKMCNTKDQLEFSVNFPKIYFLFKQFIEFIH
jgi:hypothetical protein